MKNFSSSKERIKLFLFLTFSVALFVISNSLMAQGLSQFEEAVSNEATSFRAIARTIFDIILIIGAIGVIYAYVTKQQDAKTYLIYYLIGVVVLGVLRQTVLNPSAT